MYGKRTFVRSDRSSDMGESRVPSVLVITEETQAHIRAVAAEHAEADWPPESPAAHRQMLPDLITRLQGGQIYRSPNAADVRIPADGHEVLARVIAPQSPRGVCLHLHGGGWMTGAPRLYDRALEDLAQATALTVVSVDYRKAPEHPFPAALNDCEAAARWILAEGAEALGAGRVRSIAGQSSGANLEMATLLRLRDAGLHRSIDRVSLVYGVYDLSLERTTASPHADLGPVSAEMLRWYVEHYVPDPARRGDPLVSPVVADLAELPSTLLTVGSHVPLLEDSVELHRRLLGAGVEASLDVVPGGTHGFELASLEIAEQAKARIAAFLAMEEN
jgi:acetyl esterase/lipase